MPTPNTFIIGGPKCGTTTVAEWLRQHPQVFFSDPKEPSSMGSDIEGGVPRGQYLELFKSVPREAKVIAEGSTWYLWSKDAVDRILEMNPNSKFIVCLRNPAEMAWSLHGHEIFNLRENILDFDEAWSAQKERTQGKRLPRSATNKNRLIYSRSCALGTLSKIACRKIPPSNLRFVFLDDLSSNPAREFEVIQDFLELDHTQILLSSHNAAKQRRSRIVAKIVRLAGPIKASLGLSKIKFGIASKLDRANKSASMRKKMPSETRRYLQDHFLPEVEIIENLTGRDLSHWKNQIPGGEKA